jgi:predicted ArsR family transcriptional regulator
MSPLARALQHPRRVLIQNHVMQAGEPVPPREVAEDLGMTTATVRYHLRTLIAANAPLAFDPKGRVRRIG